MGVWLRRQICVRHSRTSAPRGKFIISYADSYDQKAYYLSSVANKVILNPQGMVGLVGLASAPTFYRQALDKLGGQGS